MFKKMFKDLAENLIEKAQEAASKQMGGNLGNSDSNNQSNNQANNDVMKAFMAGDMQKAMDVGAASAGVSTMNTATESPDDPLLQPVHGITIADYGAGMAKVGAGCTDAEVCAALQVEAPMWEEAKTTWNNRMRSDQTYNVVNVYSKYFGKAKEHEKLGALQPSTKLQTNVPEAQSKATLERLESDKHYYFEIQGALQAAYDNGIDGAQWLVDELGVSVSQVNEAGFKWMTNIATVAAMDDYQEQKKKEYSEKFAKTHGTGGVADDVEF